MKGAALSVAPGLRLVDIAHDLPPHDVVHAARVLAASAPRFPVGTVHVAVVDPGVGTSRAPIVIALGGHVFVGPDNGLFSLVAERFEGAVACHLIGEHPHVSPSPSPTFHGRDLFAPTGAALASGQLDVAAVGPDHVPSLVRAEQPSTATAERVEGQVVLVDRFGNLVTNMRVDALRAAGAEMEVLIGEHALRLSATYGDVPVGRPVALIGSDGWLEIAVRDGSALDVLGLGLGSPVAASRS